MPKKQLIIPKFSNNNVILKRRLLSACAKILQTPITLISSRYNHNPKRITEFNQINKNYLSHFKRKLFSLQLFSIIIIGLIIIFCTNNRLYPTNSNRLIADELRDSDENVSTAESASLVNPMEKYFNKNLADYDDSSNINRNFSTVNQQTQPAKSTEFSDRTIPSTRNRKNSETAKKKKQSNKIKLASSTDEQNQSEIAQNPTHPTPTPNLPANVDPFNAQPPNYSPQNNSLPNTNYAYDNYNNYIANNQNNPEFYQDQNQFPQTYNQQYYTQPDQLQQNYQQYYPQFIPQYYPQYSPQYLPQYYPYPYFNGMYSPLGYDQNYGQTYDPYNYYTPDNSYGYPPETNRNSINSPENSRRNDLLEPESIRELERIAKREAAESARLEAEWSPKPPRPILYPILSKLWSCVTTLSPFNSPTGPDRGVGMPLRNSSWLDRPYYFGGFIGKINGSELVSNMIDQDNGANGGLILGYNMNEYWGLEGRLHFASIDIKETQNGAAQYAMWYAANNPGTSVYVPGLTTRSNQLTVFDVSVHYYPLGNARFRPYFKYGLGFARESFYDTFGKKQTAETLSMPFGFGLRYWWNKQFAIHAEAIDNIIFSHENVKTQGNWSLAIGLTYSFGNNNKRRPIVRWPYVPSSGSRR
ncbi:MAG: outer membrane beta-barrel protein [Planctomycetaceae bacterium]|jgi:hypothetical protein|nr:outer membrane beta-barrel protein [Planctomycetaceae bacterium]